MKSIIRTVEDETMKRKCRAQRFLTTFFTRYDTKMIWKVSQCKLVEIMPINKSKNKLLTVSISFCFVRLFWNGCHWLWRKQNFRYISDQSYRMNWRKKHFIHSKVCISSASNCFDEAKFCPFLIPVISVHSTHLPYTLYKQVYSICARRLRGALTKTLTSRVGCKQIWFCSNSKL